MKTWVSQYFSHISSCYRKGSFVWIGLALHDGSLHHIETTTLICYANQWTGFYMAETSVMKELRAKSKRKFRTKINFFETIGTAQAVFTVSKSSIPWHQNNMWDLLKVSNKYTSTTSVTTFWCRNCWLWTDLARFSGTSIANSEQVNVEQRVSADQYLLQVST